ncbi:hypothetical protein ANO11243_056340 [Dothideomycetidae sp. 11243]|nr:hypothetical protein ANO11243_056340 [fungal sp. No.11243]
MSGPKRSPQQAKRPRKPIPEHEIKQNSGVSASMALQATQKAWDLRQAANAAGDPNAREEILAKAINKEIEAESFGKAAKYTQSGAFQGLAAGAGLGVQPGVTLGKVTGAIVGGTVSTVTGLLGGGIGSVYGAMSGPMWDLGQMASHGVRGVVGDFPNWSSTPSQKKALEKMVMQSKETPVPTKEELETMKAEAPDDMPQSWSQSAKDMTGYLPSMPSMKNIPSMSSAGSALGLGGVRAAMGFGGGADGNNNKSGRRVCKTPAEQSKIKQGDQGATQQSTSDQGKLSQYTGSKHAAESRKAPNPKLKRESHGHDQVQTASSTNNEPFEKENKSAPRKLRERKAANSTQQQAQSDVQRPTSNAIQEKASATKTKASTKQTIPRRREADDSIGNNDVKSSISTGPERRKPRKLDPKTKNAGSDTTAATKRKPRKLRTGHDAI